MPIYEYHCEECNKDFESLVLGSEKPGCPFCNSENVKRLMSACGFISKGTGADGSTETVRTSASSSACAGCTSTNCSSCGL